MKINFMEKRKKMRQERKLKKIQLLICATGLAVLLSACGIGAPTEKNPNSASTPSAIEHSVIDTEPTASAESAPASSSTSDFALDAIPAFSGKAYVDVNGNKPYFTDSDLTTTSFEKYSNLDKLGRCGVAYANIGQDLMPTEERGTIGQVKPTGWHTVKYDCVDGKYLYNRCHLIGYQLTAENANTQNLITGTRYLNIEGMLPFENMVADYIKETGNHVLYRVTPVYDGDDLLATGVLMEAKSVEDEGDGVLFNVFCYNAQPGVSINYDTGDSSLAGSASTTFNTTKPTTTSTTKPSTQAPVVQTKTPQISTTKAPTITVSNEQTYVLNTNTHKFHKPSCSYVDQITAANKQDFTGSRDDLIAQGYSPCKRCNP